MKRYVLVILMISGLVFVMRAQDSVYTYTDTIRSHELLDHLTTDDLLLYLIQQQGSRLAAIEDSTMQERLNTDTTTAFPFHVGLRDSLRIVAYTKKMYLANPLLLPLYYVPEKRDSLSYNDDNLPISLQLQKKVRRYISTFHPELYVDEYQPELLSDISSHELAVQVAPLKPQKALVRDAEEDRLDKIRAIKRGNTYWYKEATTTLQVSQNYVTKNWYAGGNTNFALLGILQGKIIYNNRKNITWENTSEWRFGFNTVSGDTLRKVNTNEDIFKLYSKLGIKIVDKLNGSVSADFQTHFFNTWKDNTKNLKTGPLTPARLNVSLGLDYKPVKGLSLFFAPFTYRMVGVVDTTHVAQTSFSIEQGKKMLNEVGSSLRVDWSWHPVREVALDSKFYFYTNYSRVEIDWEITTDFIINRFLSARILLHPRYDNTVILADDERAKLQFKELISVGFSHKFY